MVIAKLRHLRISPRKVRLVTSVIKNLPIEAAEAKLLLLPKRAAPHILKLLRSAIANAKHNNHLNPKHLFVKELRVDEGPTLKRWTPRARGSSAKIEKKTSHLTIGLGTSEKIIQPGFVFPPKKKSKTKEEKSRAKKEEIKKEKREDENKKIKAETSSKKIPFFRRKSV